MTTVGKKNPSEHSEGPSTEQGVTIKPARLSPPSPPLAEVGQTRAEGIKSKEEASTSH